MEDEIQHIQHIMQDVFREVNQLADALINKTFGQQRKISIQTENQLARTCRGINRLDRSQMPNLRIKTRKINMQA